MVPLRGSEMRWRTSTSSAEFTHLHSTILVKFCKNQSSWSNSYNILCYQKIFSAFTVQSHASFDATPDFSSSVLNVISVIPRLLSSTSTVQQTQQGILNMVQHPSIAPPFLTAETSRLQWEARIYPGSSLWVRKHQNWFPSRRGSHNFYGLRQNQTCVESLDSIFHSAVYQDPSPFVLASLRPHVDVWMCCGMLSASFLRPWRLKVCRMDVAWQEVLMMFSATKWIRAILMAGFHGSIGVVGSFSLGLALERGQA